MPIPAHIFRTYDIRGLLSEVTPNIAEQVAKILIERTGARTVVLGRDMRETSPELAKVAGEAMRARGVHVIDIGMCTTPLFYFAVRHLGAGAGMMITASHNPPEYNGIKFADGNVLPMSGMGFYEHMHEEYPDAPKKGELTEADVLSEYIDACMQWPGAQGAHAAKVLVDYGNGMGAMTFRPLAKKLGLAIDELYAEPDARFPNHEANPAKEETLKEMKQKIVAGGYDFGVAFDGDADRIGFIDNEGNYLAGDLMAALFAEDALARNPGATIVTAPNQSWTVAEVLTEHGGKMVESPVGRTLMIQKMVEVKGEVSGEVSSHFFFPEFGNLESPEHAFVRVLTFWEKSGKTFADVVRHLRRYVNTGEINFTVPDKEKVLRDIQEVYGSQATLEKNLDGIRCEFNKDWWFIARPSNNEPLIRLTIEAKDQKTAEEKRAEFTRFFEDRGGKNILA